MSEHGKTPRTDEAWVLEWHTHGESGGRSDLAQGMCQFAETLETELTAMTARCEKAERERDEAYETMSAAQDVLCIALGSSVKHDRGGLLSHATQTATALTAALQANRQLREALETIAQLRADTDMDYAAAYYAMFKSDGRDAWDKVSKALAANPEEKG